MSDLKSIESVIRSGDIAMLASTDAYGYIRSRPLETVETTNLGEIIFFTTADSELINELTQKSSVNLTYIQPDKTYISVSGTSQITKNMKKIKEYWKSKYNRWIKGGIDNPELVLLKVVLIHGEQWEMKDNLQRLQDFVFKESEEDELKPNRLVN